jgi:glutamine synthetase
VRFLWCGNDSTIRAKASSRHGLAGRISSGIGLTVAMNAMNGLDHLQPVDGMGPVGEIRLVPDPETFRVLPYAPRSGAMLVDQRTLDGEPRRSTGARSRSGWPPRCTSAARASRSRSRTSSPSPSR